MKKRILIWGIFFTVYGFFSMKTHAEQFSAPIAASMIDSCAVSGVQR